MSIEFEGEEIIKENINYVTEVETKECCGLYNIKICNNSFSFFKVFFNDGTKFTYGGVPYDVSTQEAEESDLNTRRNNLIALIEG